MFGNGFLQSFEAHAFLKLCFHRLGTLFVFDSLVLILVPSLLGWHESSVGIGCITTAPIRLRFASCNDVPIECPRIGLDELSH